MKVQTAETAEIAEKTIRNIPGSTAEIAENSVTNDRRFAAEIAGEHLKQLGDLCVLGGNR